MSRQTTERLPDADSARLLPRFRDRSEMLAQQRAVLRKAAAESVRASSETVAGAGGDYRQLRGIPAISRGVSGVSPGTHPERETMRRSEKRAA